MEVETFKAKMSPITSLFSAGQEASQALGSVGSLFKTISGSNLGGEGTFQPLSSLLSAVKFIMGLLKK